MDNEGKFNQDDGEKDIYDEGQKVDHDGGQIVDHEDAEQDDEELKHVIIDDWGNRFTADCSSRELWLGLTNVERQLKECQEELERAKKRLAMNESSLERANVAFHEIEVSISKARRPRYKQTARKSTGGQVNIASTSKMRRVD